MFVVIHNVFDMVIAMAGYVVPNSYISLSRWNVDATVEIYNSLGCQILKIVSLIASLSKA